MNTIFKKTQETRKFWLNPENWQAKFDENYIKIKKTLIDTILKTKNLNDLSFYIFDDIDLLACLLNVHTIKNSIWKHKVLNNNITKDKTNRLYLLNMGVLDDDVCLELLKKTSFTKKNEELAKKILTQKDSYPFFYFFRQLLKNESFVFQLFSFKDFNSAFSLISLPGHYAISKTLLERRSFPNQITQNFHIQFNKTIFEDIKFINKLLRQYRGQELYHFLPEHIKSNEKICLNMLKYHPEINTSNQKIKTLKNFKKSSKFWFYVNDFISQLNYFNDVFSDESNFIEALECLTYFRKSSLLTNLSYKYHPFIHFLLNSEQPIIKSFLETEKGKHLLALPSSNSQEMTHIDNWVYEEFFNTIQKIQLFKKLSLKSECKIKKQMKI